MRTSKTKFWEDLGPIVAQIMIFELDWTGWSDRLNWKFIGVSIQRRSLYRLIQESIRIG